MDSVSLGANLAIQECQNQFSNRRWNCTTVLSGPVFGRVLENGRYKRLRFKTANSALKIEKFPGLSEPVNIPNSLQILSVSMSSYFDTHKFIILLPISC